MVRLATAAELWLGKPVIAINTATCWHAHRNNRITDRIHGLGRLLEGSNGFGPRRRRLSFRLINILGIEKQR